MENSRVFIGNENALGLEAQRFAALVVASIFQWILSSVEMLWAVWVGKDISLYLHHLLNCFGFPVQEMGP